MAQLDLNFSVLTKKKSYWDLSKLYPTLRMDVTSQRASTMHARVSTASS